MNVGNNSVWADGLLSADIDGTFLTYNKLGTIEGRLMGTYTPTDTTKGTWQAVTAGTWQKTKPVTFSSDIQAGVYDLSHVKYGNYTAGSQYYNYSYEDQGTRPYGWSWFSDQANKIDTSTSSL